MGVFARTVSKTKTASTQRPRYQSLSVSLLKLADYQRGLLRNKVNNYVANYDPMIFGTVLVSYRDLNYWIIDGQHRVEAARQLGIKTVWCQVIEGLTYEQEAMEFHKINTHRVPLNANQKFHALVESKDHVALDIVSILNKYGMVYSRKGQEFVPNCVTAIGSVQTIYAKYGAEQLDEVLSIIKRTWNGDFVSLRAEILKGINTFINNYTYDSNVLVKVLVQIKPLDFINMARGSVVGKRLGRSDGTCFHIAKTIRDLYEEYAIEHNVPVCGRKGYAVS